MVIEVVVEFSVFFFFIVEDGGDQVGVFLQIVMDFCQQCGVFGKLFYQNIVCVVQGCFVVGYVFIGINIFCGFCFWIVGWFVLQQVSQWFEFGFDSDLFVCMVFWFVGQVEIFQFGFVECGVDGFFQCVGQFVLFSDGFEDCLMMVFEFVQIVEVSFQIMQLCVIQIVGDFFMIMCNKWYGVFFIKQVNGSFYLFGFGLKFICNNVVE